MANIGIVRIMNHGVTTVLIRTAQTHNSTNCKSLWLVVEIFCHWEKEEKIFKEFWFDAIQLEKIVKKNASEDWRNIYMRFELTLSIIAISKLYLFIMRPEMRKIITNVQWHHRLLKDSQNRSFFNSPHLKHNFECLQIHFDSNHIYPV